MTLRSPAPLRVATGSRRLTIARDPAPAIGVLAHRDVRGHAGLHDVVVQGFVIAEAMPAVTAIDRNVLSMSCRFGRPKLMFGAPHIE